MRARLFTSTQTTPITIYSTDLKQCIDVYLELKKLTIGSNSKHIQHLQQLYANYQPDKVVPLNLSDIKSLAILLVKVENDDWYSPKSAQACQMLIQKMEQLLPYAHDPMPIFSKVVACPKLHDYIVRIKEKIPNSNPESLLENHADALRFIAEHQDATQAALTYCSLAQTFHGGYHYLLSVSKGVDRLLEADRIIYHNLKTVVTHHTESSNEQVYDHYLGMYFRKKTNYETNTIHDLSKNQVYKAQISTIENIRFLFQHPEQADVIADVLIKLHEGMIGTFYQDQAERCIRQLRPELFAPLAKALLSDALLKQLTRSYKEQEFEAIISPYLAIPVPPVYEQESHALTI